MNDEELKKLGLAIEATIPEDCLGYSNPYDSDAILYAVQKAWQAACEYKDKSLINGTRMKQMNERIEELLIENAKLRECVELIAGDQEFYCEVGDANKQAYAREVLKELENK